jgi:hypothetical protein
MSMRRREILPLAGLVGLAGLAATPGLGQGRAAAPAIPDLSGPWRHPSLPGFEPPAFGPGPVTNKSRRPDGASNWNLLVGDDRNPILKPSTAAAVKKMGDLSLAGVMPPTPANQCWPQPVPYIFWTFNLQLVQQSDKVTILYSNPDHEFRQVRMNASHPAKVAPSWYGDSVGHYEGDTLVVDTIGIKAARPYAMVDAYGTPYSDSLHVVERYRLLDYAEAKEGLDRDAKENQRIPQGDIDRNYRGKHLQLHFTVEDATVFTTPWSATMTYGRGSDVWDEQVCAENTREYTGKSADVPTATRLDF